MQKQRLYRYLYLLIFTSFFVSTFPVIRYVLSDDDAIANAAIPSKSNKKIVEEFNRLQKAAGIVAVSDDPLEYFRFLTKAFTLQQVSTKQLNRDIEYRAGPNNALSIGLRIDRLINEVHLKYNKKFPSAVILKASEEHFPHGSYDKKKLPAIRPRLWGYLYRSSIPFMFVFFLLRLRAVGLSILIEFVQFWKLILAVLFWPVGIFVYPTADPARQLKSALRFASFVLASSLSGFLGAAKINAQTQTVQKRRQAIGLQLEGWIYPILERQFWVRGTYGSWIFYNQNFRSADGKNSFSHIGAGRLFSVNKAFQLRLVSGPQYTYSRNTWDRMILFVNGSAKTTMLDATFANRLSVGMIPKTPFVSAHLQAISFSGLPPWIKLRTEQLQGVGKWQQGRIGIEFAPQRKILGGQVKFFPHYDFLRGTPDVAFHYILNFQ